MRPSRGVPTVPGLSSGPLVNAEAEMALLGAILANNRAYDRVCDFLRVEHFADAGHQEIYGALRIMLARDEMATPITLKGYFDARGALAEIGGTAYLAKLAAATPSSGNAENYGRLILDLYLRRALVEEARAISKKWRIR